MGLDPAARTAFLAGLTPPSSDAARADRRLDERLAAALATARAQWPELRVDEAEFTRYLAERIDGETDPGAALANLRIGELYLACACVAGQPRALTLLDERYFRDLDAVIGRMNLGSAHLDDVKQTLRQQLLVASESGPPRLAQYAGSGALAGWLRVSATRAALKLARPMQREVADEDDRLLALPAVDNAPELAQLRRDYQADFRTAFLTALGELPDREKNLIRQHHLDGLSVDDLAALYKVHRATAARWVAGARQTLLSRTRELLIERVAIDPNDCDSIMRLVHSQLDLTLRRLLG